jgi:hypothetical protein
MQPPRDLSADALRASGDQNGFAVEARGGLHKLPTV